MSMSQTLDRPLRGAAASTGTQRLRVPCTIEMAHTADDCYAHVLLDGVEVGPGDEVLVHDAPTQIAWGERLRCERQATVSRASWLARLWTRLGSRFELTVLYEVSFSPTRFSTSRPYPRPRRPLATAATIAPPHDATASAGSDRSTP